MKTRLWQSISHTDLDFLRLFNIERTEYPLCKSDKSISVYCMKERLHGEFTIEAN
jgi:hypothetical protein